MILLLGGTSDARELARAIQAAGHEVVLSTVTVYGAQLAAEDGLAVRSGALNTAELSRLVADAVAVVDATHPFAEQISRAAQAVCRQHARPYLRFERPAEPLPADVLRAPDAATAAHLAVSRASSGAILLTVGSKTVNIYVEVARRAGVRVIARVLPTPESLAACAAAGLQASDIVALQGPTSAELDAALLRHFGATVLVAKESGSAGGLGEKLRAVRAVAGTAVVVERPAYPANLATSEETVVAHNASEVLQWLADLGGEPRKKPVSTRFHLPHGLLQVYTGTGKGKTTAAVGLALRARGAGLAVSFVQFVKGGRESSELALLRASGARVVRPATHRSGLLRHQVRPEDRTAASEAWATARAVLSSPDVDVVVLDELHGALRYGLVELDDVLAALSARPVTQEVISTGRGAPEQLLALADLVTEMKPVRHPYPQVAARRGIEL